MEPVELKDEPVVGFGISTWMCVDLALLYAPAVCSGLPIVLNLKYPRRSVASTDQPASRVSVVVPVEEA